MSQVLRTTSAKLPRLIVLFVAMIFDPELRGPGGARRTARPAGADGVCAGWDTDQRREVPHLYASVRLERRPARLRARLRGGEPADRYPRGPAISAGRRLHPDAANSLGYAFATTSYSVNGLAIKQGLPDLVDLVNIFRTQHPTLKRVVLVGVSEGGLITTLATEQYPTVFNGGVAACGPIGDFRGQINYVGDFRVVFDYFFPGLDPRQPGCQSRRSD